MSYQGLKFPKPQRFRKLSTCQKRRWSRGFSRTAIKL